MRWVRLGVAGLASALLLTACSGGFTRADAVASFLEANPDASTTEANCVIDALIETHEDPPVDEDDLAGLEAQLLADPPDDSFVRDQFLAEFGCGLTADVEQQLRRELLANDIDPDAVDCVAADLVGRLTEDDLDLLVAARTDPDAMTDSFYATFFASVEACDALPN